MTKFVEIGCSYRHHKSKVVYEVYDLTNEHALPENSQRYPVTVSYVGPNGKRWSKPVSNFLETMRHVRNCKCKLKQQELDLE